MKYVCCAYGSSVRVWEVMSRGPGATSGVTIAGGRSCCRSSSKTRCTDADSEHWTLSTIIFFRAPGTAVLNTAAPVLLLAHT